MWTIGLAAAAGMLAYAAYAWAIRSSRFRISFSLPLRIPFRRRHPGEEKKADIGDYDACTLTGAERAIVCSVAAGVAFAIGYLFYRHIGISLLLGLTAAYAPRLRRAQLIRRRRDELRKQFKHSLYSLSSSLSAGKSVENAFREAAQDLKLLYPDPRTDLLRELERINRRTENGEPIEKSLTEFARRSGIEDIEQFADAFAACKRTGGDLVDVMRRTANMIGEKMDIEQDISVLIAQKKFEAKALGWLPFGIVAFLAFGSPDYMEPLYGGAGRLVMTVSLALLGLSQWLAHRIMDIRT